ncbi:GH36-type glycosyl hydrolase domain-containing protein [Undibacterium terreum]
MSNSNSPGGNFPSGAEEELPLRAELFGAIQMEQHGKALATSHQLSGGRLRDQLLVRLADNEIIITETCNLLAAAVKEDRQVTPAAEWLLDNFYLIEEQIRTAKKHLPKGYSKELPRLQKGASAGMPRVYDIALETISHGDGRVDPESLSRFVAAYQQVTALRLGELWAIPIMLRLALIENLRRVAVRIANDRYNRDLANSWADQMLETADKEPSRLILLVADMARSEPPMVGSFVAEMVRRLQGQSPGLSLPLTWMAQHLSEAGMTVEQLIQLEAQQQAADQVSISNSIGSLRFLGSMDWQEFVETMSAVEHVLANDSGDVYSKMDFATRDRYRHVIEGLAKYSLLSEVEIAEKAIQLATQAANRHGQDDRKAHIGFYLVADGLPELEKAVGLRKPVLDKIKSTVKRTPLSLYLGSVLALTALLSASLAERAYEEGAPLWLLIVLALVAVIATSQLAVALINWASTLLALPHLLPRMDFSKGIPSNCRTLVVVPTLISSEENIDSLCEDLEVRYLANVDTHLHFCLLTDFNDAASETTPQDESLLNRLQQNIIELNKKYADDEHQDADCRADAFLAFHRPRRWNPREKVWMGYERKRGKLADLNAFLRGTALNPFSLIVGETSELANVRYVITLDTDTQLARETARQFVGTMAHPLNRGRYDELRQRVVEGYGILQPRVAVNLPGSHSSYYEKLFSGEAGLDPYTRTVSDVYQDLFQEGSFIGKGIYDVDLFERAMHNRFPENRILSHDLLEGCYIRSGLLSDLQLLEDYPARYSVDVKRRHRWVRGDWQIISWLFPKVPLPKASSATLSGARSQKNPLSALSRWKLFDNLRRSMVPASLMALLLLGWGLLPTPWFWTRAVLGVLLIPSIISSAMDLLHKDKDVLYRQHITAVIRASGRHFSHALLNIIFLPYEAWFTLDAIFRTMWRMLITHKKMLEWSPFSEVIRSDKNGLAATFRTMWIAPVLSALIGVGLLYLNPAAFLEALPLLLVWLVSPAVAWWISRPVSRSEAQLRPEQTVYLHKLARKTWSFFETYVSAADNWLPPDNMQEQPVSVLARRTSPTNIGLALLANLSAHDFGYISAGQLLERTKNTLQTMGKLERYKGHFYNWYNTETLQPLHPIYISTVDSGNLAGHLLVLGPGLQQLSDLSILNSRLFEGISDTCKVLKDCIDAGEQPSVRKLLDPLGKFQLLTDNYRQRPPETLAAACEALDLLATSSAELTALLDVADDGDISWWARSLALQCCDAYEDLLMLAPWARLSTYRYWNNHIVDINAIPTLGALAAVGGRLQLLVDATPAQAIPQEDVEHFNALLRMVQDGSQNAAQRIADATRLAQQASDYAQIEYEFLYDKATHLLAIGYNLSDRRRDNSYYDLLASEARLCTFVAIAQGKLPQESWFALGRQMTLAGGEPVLVSWSGSMFEYLMPLLVMPNYDNTLLDQTYTSVVQRQLEYGRQRNVCWGISESAYYTFDSSLNYQYRAFGVPGLGLKRGLGDDLVVAPYASMMALMVAPEEACVNLQNLSREGFEGRFGLYEAIDHTPSRMVRGQSHALIRSFMSHHQGMGFLSLAYLLLDKPMQKRFASYPLFQATMLLLQERVPKETAYYANTTELADIRTTTDGLDMPVRIMTRSDTRVPETQLLSNGRYHLMLTNSGGGYSRWKDLAVTRWREDGTRDHWGNFCYIRDLSDGSFWSTAFQPTRKQPDSYEVNFSEGRAEIRRKDGGIELHTEIVVSPEDDIELRRTHVTNRSRMRKVVDVTSYTEVVLAPAAADAAHTTFSNLFVQTEILPDKKAILSTRRPRSLGQQMPWMLNLMSVHGLEEWEVAHMSFETDRSRFIGRGNTVAAPAALLDTAALSGSQGSVLDPVAAIRCQLELEPGQTIIVDMVTGASETREDALHLIDKYRDRHLADRVFELAWTHSHVVLRQLNASEADAQLYGRLANYVIYANSLLRADASVLIKNRRGQSGLWSYAISGDLPIVLLQIRSVDNIDLVRQLVQAHAYWRLKGLAVDLVIWNEDHASYRQILQDQIMGLIASGTEAQSIDRPGGIFVRFSEQMPSEDRILMQSVARVILSDNGGTLAEQVARRHTAEVKIPQLLPTRRPDEFRITPQATAVPARELILFNGLGGFTPDGREYVITTQPGDMGSSSQTTPAPWVNVLANPQFGTVVSESGQAYTWGQNAHEFRVTPWNNDPVSDPSGEVYYLRDEESGQFWSPTSLPCKGQGSYTTRHGFGYSVFEHTENGIQSELLVYVALDASIKYSVLKVRNVSDSTRKLSATGYTEWVLGDLRPKSLMHIVTELDASTGALFARNSYNTEFADRIAFFDVDATIRSHTCDRAEFIGRNNSLQNPAAMGRVRLSGKSGAGLDPCSALQVPFELAPQQEREIVFMLGVTGRRSEDVSSLIHRYRGAMAAREALDKVHVHWKHVLSAVQVKTPDLALNVLANGWLIYQTVACRLWARSGFYQSGGAYGFRDQLQDTMALVHAEPHLMRDHLLLCSAHQFIDGDVQHWWHPPSDRGVRTHCSDDYLWLPLAVHRYIVSTGDASVLDETTHFLDGRQVNTDEDSYYDLPLRSTESADLYEHCVRAIRRGLRFGVHGLPLIGSCDWNDGMDKVGEHGKGESVWLAFFLYEVLMRFAEISDMREDAEFSVYCRSEAEKLRNNIEQQAWDGDWYRRAYFDDGTPLGSSANPECQIDSISQSWAVLSGAGEAGRTRHAMDKVNERLVRRDSGLVQLLDPPFSTSDLNPGYIRGYVPGVRENGGQYTHAAIWTAMAFARLDDSERAWDVLRMINPVNHGRTPEEVAVYKVEPYVVAADVYAVAPHTGRGGWTWYTGSSGWMYRLIVESLLGLQLNNDKLSFKPCLPEDWESFELVYRYRDTRYQIRLIQLADDEPANAGILLDGALLLSLEIPLVNDREEHQVVVSMQRPRQNQPLTSPGNDILDLPVHIS